MNGHHCKDHPKYAAKRRPRAKCAGCWWVYYTVQLSAAFKADTEARFALAQQLKYDERGRV